MKKTTKGIIAIASSIAIIGFIFYKIKSKRSGGGNSGTGGGGSNGGDGGTGGGGTGGVKNFNALANDLFVCLDDYGTAWDNGPSGGVVGIISSLKSDADFDALSNAFGIRKINCGTLNPFCSDFEGNMVNSLNNELDSSELNEINEILQSKGINRSI